MHAQHQRAPQPDVINRGDTFQRGCRDWLLLVDVGKLCDPCFAGRVMSWLHRHKYIRLRKYCRAWTQRGAGFRLKKGCKFEYSQPELQNPALKPADTAT